MQCRYFEIWLGKNRAAINSQRMQLLHKLLLLKQFPGNVLCFNLCKVLEQLHTGSSPRSSRQCLGPGQQMTHILTNTFLIGCCFLAWLLLLLFESKLGVGLPPLMQGGGPVTSAETVWYFKTIKTIKPFKKVIIVNSLLTWFHWMFSEWELVFLRVVS